MLAIAVAIGSFTSCKKDSNSPNASKSGSYAYAGTQYNISSAAEKHIGGDIFLEFDSGSTGNYLQIDLPNTASLPIGILTYNADRNSRTYDALKNFWSTGVGIAGNNTDANGGTVTIAKTDGGYKITFNISTANGKITGEYNGTPTKI